VQPALVGGLVMGVMSALPLINTLNVCCCLWVVSGGLVATYVLQQNQSTPMSAGQGAVVGLLAGLVGAVIVTVISIPISFLVAPVERALADRVLAMSGNLPPELRQMLESYGEPRTDVGLVGQFLLRAVGFFIMLMVGAVFSTLGGLLGVALFTSRPAPAQTE
jgi:hypothetical protein